MRLAVQTILARHVGPGDLDQSATINALLTALDDSGAVDAARELERTLGRLA